MYIDWVIVLSLIIVVLTCVLLAYGIRYSMLKINEETDATKAEDRVHS